MAYVVLSTIHDPATGTSPPATYGDQINDNFEAIRNNVERVITQTTLSSASSAINSGTLPSVTNGWRLRIVCELQLTTGSGVTALLRFNADAGSNYHRQIVTGSSATVAGSADGSGTTSLILVTNGADSASRWAIGEWIVPSYLSAHHKVVVGSALNPAALAGTQLLVVGGGVWVSTSAITSVSITAASSTFVAGSTLTLLATPANP